MTKPVKPRRKAEDWAKLVEAWKQSGKTAQAFGQEHDIPAAALYAWNSRLKKREGPRRSGLSFVPVVVRDEPEAGRAESGVHTRWEIRCADEITVAMTGPGAVEGLEVALRTMLVSGRGK